MNPNTTLSILNDSEQIVKIDYTKIEYLSANKILLNGQLINLSNNMNMFLLENRIAILDKLNQIGEQFLTEELLIEKEIIQFPEKYDTDILMGYGNFYWDMEEIMMYLKRGHSVVTRIGNNKKQQELLTLINHVKEKAYLEKNVSDSNVENKSHKLKI
jgi:hypothetical protein